MSKSGDKNYYVEDGILEFKNNNLSILTSNIFDVSDIDKSKKENLLKQAEEESKKTELNDQAKFLIDQKVEVLKSIN